MTDGGDKVKVTLIANAGLLLEFRREKLIIDGMFSGEGHPFGDIPAEIWEKELSGQPPFDGVGHLLFTHCHVDHFSPSLTLKYLHRNRIRTIFLPEADKQGTLTEYLREKKTACVPLSEELGHAVFKLSEDISVGVIKTKHLDRKFVDVEHFCFLITFGEKRLLFTGDADYVTESFSVLGDTALDAVFINPLFFSALCRERFFTGRFNTALYCVCHLPSGQGSDEAQRTVERELRRWDGRLGRAVILSQKNRSLEI